MPTSAPVAGAPATVWAGNQDAQAMATAAGVPWAAPLFALNRPRVLDIAVLCASPPPAVPAFTTTDLVRGYLPFQDEDMLAKLEQASNAALWPVYCEYTDATPPPVIDDQPPPGDLPEGPPPPAGDPHAASVYFWVKWLVEQTVPRLYVDGTRIVATGSGSAFVPTRTSGKWETWAAGFRWRVDEKADFEAHIGDSPNAIWWDLGWITAGTSAGVAAPIRVQREFGTVYGYTQHIDSISWTLPPDVTLSIWPLMPLTAEETG